jgi:hypothetical protein
LIIGEYAVCLMKYSKQKHITTTKPSYYLYSYLITSDAEENPNYTIGEILSADKTGVDSDEFAQLALFKLVLLQDGMRLGNKLAN